MLTTLLKTVYNPHLVVQEKPKRTDSSIAMHRNTQLFQSALIQNNNA
jgi:hypothetical protein